MKLDLVVTLDLVVALYLDLVLHLGVGKDARFFYCKFEAPNAIEGFNFKALLFLKYAFNPHDYDTRRLKKLVR